MLTEDQPKGLTEDQQNELAEAMVLLMNNPALNKDDYNFLMYQIQLLNIWATLKSEKL